MPPFTEPLPIFDYIEVFYSRRRIHSASHYFAPAEYEARDPRAVETSSVRLEGGSLICLSTKGASVLLVQANPLKVFTLMLTRFYRMLTESNKARDDKDLQ